MALTPGVVHASFYGAQVTLFAALFPAAEVRYTGMSFVHQVSGIHASGITPLLMTALLALGNGTPWLACGHLALTALVSTVATHLVRLSDRLFATAHTPPVRPTADLPKAA